MHHDVAAPGGTTGLRRRTQSTMLRRALVTTAVAAALVSLAPSAGAREAPPAPSHGSVVRFGGTECRLVGVPEVSARTASLIRVGGTCPGVRPGAIVLTDIGMCSLNFVFRGSDGARYIGTAGHCLLEDTDVAERSWARGRGPVARDASGRRFGEFAYAVLRDPKDFALIRIDEGVRASAEMCHFGGPVGTNTSRSPVPVGVQHYGNGLAVGELVPARTSVALSLADRDQVTAIGTVVPGDSGSGALDGNGRALGVIVTTGISVGGPAYTGTVGITRLEPQLRRATEVTRVRYVLETAPRR